MKKSLSILGLLLLAISGWYVYSLYSHVNETMDKIYTPIEDNEVEAETKNPDNQIQVKQIKNIEIKQEVKKAEQKLLKPISLLLLGIDGKGHKGNRSDAIVVMTFNPKKNQVTTVSIPRDTRTLIVGKGKQDKINHAYAFGGPQMTIDTVEQFLSIPIDYFVSVNMKGFEDMINLLGGIEVYNDFAFTEEGIHIPMGEQTLDGKKALAFARMRKSDPLGDVGRNKRQRMIIQAIMEKGARFSSISKAKDILAVVGNNTKTNITLADVKTLQQYYEHSTKKEALTFTGKGERIQGKWFYVISESERAKISAQLKEQLKE